MRKFVLVLTLAIAVIWAPSLLAQTHECKTLGYSVDLPEGWHCLDQEYIRTDSKLLPAAVENANKGPWKTADKEMLGNVRQMVSSGDVEYYVNPNYAGSIISVTRVQGELPRGKAEISKLCDSLPAELSKMVGRPVRVYECQASTVGSSNALFVTADAYSEGSKSHLYEIQKSPDQILVFTATCQDPSCDAMREELTSLVGSVRFQ